MTIAWTKIVSAGWRGSGWFLSMSIPTRNQSVRYSCLQLTQWRQHGCLNWWMRYEIQRSDTLVTPPAVWFKTNYTFRYSISGWTIVISDLEW